MSAKKKPEVKENDELWIAPDIRRIMGGDSLAKTFVPLSKEPVQTSNRLLDLADVALANRARQRRRKTDPK